MSFRVRKDSLIAEFRISRSDDVTALIEDAGVDSLPYDKRWGRYRLRLKAPEVEANRDLLVDLVRRASNTPPPVED